MSAPPALVLAGPTASGKSALALMAARAFDGVVINADSMQVYRELRVLTARPTAGDEALAPHRLYGIISAAEPCSAGRWLALAWAAIDESHAAGRLPIVTGGSGLYLKALLEGLAPIPPVPAAVRVDAERLYAELGGERFRAALARRDAEAATRLPPGDRQRLTRAWEIVEATGRTQAEWQRAAAPPPPLRTLTVVLLPPRAALAAAIDARLAGMLRAGALEEVRALTAAGLDPGLPAMKAVGVRELADHLAGHCTLPAAAERTAQVTRSFAKRQATWLRHQLAADVVLNEQFSERLRTAIFSDIRHQLLTPSP